ncbi:DUF3592 domain-containing protein [bacterium]|nr:MAG: DUF3592 domain-containing protein [bacterium]
MTLFWIVFLFAGLFGMVVGASQFFTGVRSSKWPATNGRIIASDVLVKERSNRDTTYYQPQVTYTYSVAGQNYRSSQISAGEHESSDIRRARKITDRYPREIAVTVFYNPRDPANAVLEPGMSISAILIFVLAAGFFVAAILGLLGIIGGKGTPASS